jgi:hypothetical protein
MQTKVKFMNLSKFYYYIYIEKLSFLFLAYFYYNLSLYQAFSPV